MKLASRIILCLSLMSLAALQVVITTTCGAPGDNNAVIMTTPGFQCIKHV